MQKYKPCCSTVCLVLGCETRSAGGCYCVCRLKDHESTCLRLLDGTEFRKNGARIYDPGRTPIPLEGDEKEDLEKELAEVRRRLKEYELLEGAW